MEKEVYISDITGKEIGDDEQRMLIEIRRFTPGGNLDERYGVRILDASQEDIDELGWDKKGRHVSLAGRRRKQVKDL